MSPKEIIDYFTLKCNPNVCSILELIDKLDDDKKFGELSIYNDRPEFTEDENTYRILHEDGYGLATIEWGTEKYIFQNPMIQRYVNGVIVEWFEKELDFIDNQITNIEDPLIKVGIIRKIETMIEPVYARLYFDSIDEFHRSTVRCSPFDPDAHDINEPFSQHLFFILLSIVNNIQRMFLRYHAKFKESHAELLYFALDKNKSAYLNDILDDGSKSLAITRKLVFLNECGALNGIKSKYPMLSDNELSKLVGKIIESQGYDTIRINLNNLDDDPKARKHDNNPYNNSKNLEYFQHFIKLMGIKDAQ